MVDYDVNEVWEKIKEVIKKELNLSLIDILYNIWFELFVLVCFDDNDILILWVFVDFYRDIVINRYFILILNVLRDFFLFYLSLKVIFFNEVEKYKKFLK